MKTLKRCVVAAALCRRVGLAAALVVVGVSASSLALAQTPDGQAAGNGTIA